MKFQSNFGVRTLLATQVQGLMEQYLHHLYEFTVICLKTKLNNKRQIMSEVMAHLNQVWHRLSFETIQCKIEGQKKVETYIENIVGEQINENIAMHGDAQKVQNELNNGPDDVDSEGSEDFHKGQRTQKADDYDQFSKLMRQKIEFSISFILDKFN